MSELPRVVCPHCGRLVVRRKDGRPKNHYPPPMSPPSTAWCAGRDFVGPLEPDGS